MSLSTRTLPAIYNGISRQPAILRAPDQTEDELNTWASLSSGVEKRPPTVSLAQIAASVSPDAFIHFINRDTTERYVVVIEGGQIKVYDLQGNPKTVNAPEGLGYVASGSFRAVTIADYTFIVNTSVACQMAAVGQDVVPDPASYRWVNRTFAGADLNLELGQTYGYNVAGGTYQYYPNASGGTYAGELPTMEKLPDNAANGTIYKITGSSETGFRSFYVRRNGAVWDETVALGLQNQIASTSMPHALVREADGTFTFAPFSWAPRRVGDQNTNPPPTFIGRTLQDVFFYQNRLAFLVDENVIFSCAGDFGNFWRTTVLDALASDVVDVAVTTAQVSLLQTAVPFNDGVILFADQTQFSLTNGEDGVTPSSVAIRPVTNYRINPNARPVTVGTEIYFTGAQNGKSVVWGYTRQDDVDSTAAAEISAHVPGLIPANVTDMVALPKGLLLLTGGTDVYCYQLYWNGNEKIVSAWRRWEFGGNVIAGTQLDSSVYLLVVRGDGLFLEQMDMDENAKPTQQPFQTYLDRRKSILGVYNPGTDRTTFTLPYQPDQSKFRIVRSIGSTAPHSLIDPSGYIFDSPTVVTVPGDERAATCTVGEAYDMRLVFSRQFPLTPQGAPMTSGRLQLRTFRINFTETAFFRTEVQPYGTAIVPNIEDIVPAKLADFTGKVIGAASLTLNSPVYHEGSYAFQIYGDAAQAIIALSNDTHVGSTFVSAEWEGFYNNRTYG